MTVAVAVRKADRLFLAADTLMNFGGERYPRDNCRVDKIYRVGSSALAWAGWSLYAEMLDAYFLRHAPPSLRSETEVFSFFIQFWRLMRDDYTFVRQHTPEDRHPFVDLDSTFLIASHAGIFKVSRDMNITTFQQYCAIGSGAAYALGALRILYEQEPDAAVIARRAVQVGIDFDVHCGGSVDVIEVRPDSRVNEEPAPTPTPESLRERADGVPTYAAGKSNNSGGNSAPHPPR
jgi:ATP-dependent protease HslVU (ClpYQ) peptidase subunit